MPAMLQIFRRAVGLPEDNTHDEGAAFKIPHAIHPGGGILESGRDWLSLTHHAAALLLESRIGQRFEAIVTGASDNGTWVRLLDPPVEGKLAGITRGLDVGDMVNVELISTNVERGHINFSRV
jgi:RNase II-type exonuclease C-terminal S1 domain